MWQSIETAPKDGTKILLWTTTVGDAELTKYLSTINDEPHHISCAQIGWYDPGNDGDEPLWHREAGWELTDAIGNPTHWMPLPGAPAVLE